VLRLAMRHKLAVVGFAAGVLVVAFVFIAPNLGSEFVPRLSEGAFVLGVVRLPGTDLAESVRYNTQIEKALLAAFPDEINHVWSRVGTAEVATDPMGVEETDIFITLKPRAGWTKARTQEELGRRIEEELRDLPGQHLEISQPIEQRVNEMISGSRADVVVKLFGDDFEILKDRARAIEAVLQDVRGVADLKTEPL